MNVPSIQKLKKTLLVGNKINMSLTKNLTLKLWQTFMPQKNKIKNTVDQDHYSVETYEPGFFNDFNPTRPFSKWAMVKVNRFEDIPEGMETLVIPEGKYAMFKYIGRSDEVQTFYQYIFTQWLPASEFMLDDRPHFARMGMLYKNDDPESEEEIWIPIKEKTNT